MGLSLTILGCGGTYAGPGNACSSYLLRTATTTVLCDLGPGALANAQRHIDLVDVDAIVLTHEHADHWTDLPVARNVYRYVLDRPLLPIFATAGTQALARALCGAGEPFAWTTITDGATAAVGDMAFRFSRTDHPVETLAVLAEADGASLVYSADTGPGWSPLAFGVRPDLALVEATFDREHTPGAPHRRAGGGAGGRGRCPSPGPDPPPARHGSCGPEGGGEGHLRRPRGDGRTGGHLHGRRAVAVDTSP